MKIFSGTDRRVIGLKFEGSSVSPCLCINILQAFFHSDGTCPDNQFEANHLYFVSWTRRARGFHATDIGGYRLIRRRI